MAAAAFIVFLGSIALVVICLLTLGARAGIDRFAVWMPKRLATIVIQAMVLGFGTLAVSFGVMLISVEGRPYGWLGVAIGVYTLGTLVQSVRTDG